MMKPLLYIFSLLVLSNLATAQIVPSDGNYGIFTETSSSMTAGEVALDVDAAIYPWSNTLETVANAVPFDGTSVLAYQQADGTEWFGMGIAAIGDAYNLAAFSIEGYLHFELSTTTTASFDIRMESSAGTGSITFANGSDPYGFVRDGAFHSVEIPLADFVSLGVDLQSISQLFILAGAGTGLGPVSIDNIYYGGGLSFDDPRLDGTLTTIEVQTAVSNINIGTEIGLWATGYNQYGAPMDIASFSWATNLDGAINQSAQFTGYSEALYTVSATTNDKNGAAVTGSKAVAVYNNTPQSNLIPNDGNFAIFAEDPSSNTAGKIALGVDANIYIWENTMTSVPTDASEGTDVLSFESGGKGWLGMSIAVSTMNLSAYTCADGVLNIDIKTDQTNNFNINMVGGDVTSQIAFNNGSDPYGFVRDGNWHSVEIPLADFVGLDVTQVTQIFQFVSESDIAGEIAFDNIYLKNGYAWSDPCLAAELSTVAVSAPKYKILTNQSVQLSAIGLSQYQVEYPEAVITWSVNNGGSITADGLFTASSNQTYTVSATTQNENGANVVGTADIIMTDNIPVYTSGRHVFVDGERYIIKGICYGPVPIGSGDRSFETLTQDIALMKEAGINTIRTYSPITEVDVLDELAANDIKVIMGFTSGNGNYNMASGEYLDYINLYKNHDAILFWDLGNEYNYHPEWFNGDMDNWYTLMNTAAAAIHAVDFDHPVSTAHGELPTQEVLDKCPNVDVWGMNVYRWDQSHTAVTDFAEISELPCYISEAGGDSYNTVENHPTYAFGENQQMQADANDVILEGLFNHLDVGSGVAMFSFTDGWWKAGNYGEQDPGGFAPNSSGVPYDGAPNEEYWGIVDIYRNKKVTFDIIKNHYTSTICLISAQAGSDQLLEAGVSTTSLDGSSSYDPEGGTLSYAWTQSSGASVSIGNANAAVASISGLASGEYSFTLTVAGSCGSRTDEISITVEENDGQENTAPVANAGSDVEITLPVSTVDLVGSGTDADGDALTYAWSQISGPNTATWSSINAAASTVSNLQEGVYQFSLTVSDGQLSAQSSVQITVIPEAIVGILIPGTVEAEDFSAMFGIQTQNTEDVGGGLNVGWTDAGDWLDYEVYVATAGSYTVDFRLSSPDGGDQLQLLSNGTELTTIDISATLNWQYWTTISEVITLAAGTQTLRLSCVTGGFNVNYLTFTAGGTVTNTAPMADAGENQSITLPINSVSLVGSATDAEGDALTYSWSQISGPNTAAWSSTSAEQPTVSGLVAGTYVMELSVSDGALSDQATVEITVEAAVAAGLVIPGRVEAEDFNTGGQNVGYYDTSAGNTGGAYNTTEDVDIQITSDSEGAYNVGWIAAGEWLAYDVTASSSSFDVALRVASPNTSGAVHLEIDGVDVTGTINIPNTGSWHVYTDVLVEDISIAVGNHVLKVVIESTRLNLNYIDFTERVTIPTGCSQTAVNGDYSVDISEDSENPTITFVPTVAGTGDETLLFYYSTNQNGPFGGHWINDGTSYQVNAANGETVYFYYTYNVPEGGERNSAANKHSFVVGDCAASSARIGQSKTDIASLELTIYPNPAQHTLYINAETTFDYFQIMDMSGRIKTSDAINDAHSVIDLQDLQSGYYLLRLVGEQGVEVKKFFKQ